MFDEKIRDQGHRKIIEDQLKIPTILLKKQHELNLDILQKQHALNIKIQNKQSELLKWSITATVIAALLGAVVGNYNQRFSVIVAQPLSLTKSAPRLAEKNSEMNTIEGKISSDYGWEITVFHKIRDATDGVSIFDMKINWDRYIADHSPRFEFHIFLLNYTVVEINIYYLHHRDNE